MRRKALGIAGVEVVMILLAVYRARARVVRDGYDTSYLGTSETTMAWGLTYSFAVTDSVYCRGLSKEESEYAEISQIVVRTVRVSRTSGPRRSAGEMTSTGTERAEGGRLLNRGDSLKSSGAILKLGQ
jgi:hypothetical protein